MSNQQTPHNYYPVSLDVTGKKCAVIGGGQIAFRKAEGLLECGAHVIVISPEICPAMRRLAAEGKITLIQREYRTGDLNGAFVAIAATDSSIINRQAAEDARVESVLVNSVDDAGNCDFIAPSVIRRGHITVAVSTAGKSPTLARKLRTLLEKQFGEEYAVLAQIIGEVRAESRNIKAKVSAEEWQEAIDIEKLLPLIKQGNLQEAKALLKNNLKKRQINNEARIQYWNTGEQAGSDPN